MYTSCPWCTAAIDVSVSDQSGVCPDCGGEYAICIEVELERRGADPLIDQLRARQEPTQRAAPDQCPGGDGCTCCRPGCDCGCRDDCPVWRRLEARKSAETRVDSRGSRDERCRVT